MFRVAGFWVQMVSGFRCLDRRGFGFRWLRGFELWGSMNRFQGLDGFRV